MRVSRSGGLTQVAFQVSQRLCPLVAASLFGWLTMGIAQEPNRPAIERASTDLADEPVQWVVSQVIPAEEAFQAAAADDEHFYAIGNQVVAKYSRASGERVAVSRGDATHLNSGFFFQGRLYCAHSNYPQKPERSEIKVLDVESMELSTFQDFGDSSGSLTWVIHHDGHWWCNFAFYGDENHRTVLIQFDDAWREQGRWTLPKELISQLGRYSLSGGIWRDGEWLVTGHDDPVVFRLQVPDEGDVLNYLGQQVVPFTGQGIAADPVSGGLIGIQRPKRVMVLARQKNIRNP